MDVGIIGDVVAVISQGRGVKGQQPDGGDPQILEVIQLLGETPEVPNTVLVAVIEGAHVQFINDGILIPQRVISQLSMSICCFACPLTPCFLNYYYAASPYTKFSCK